MAPERDPVIVIDVRSPAEFATVHVTGSCNVPLDLLGGHAEQAVCPASPLPVATVCAVGQGGR